MKSGIAAYCGVILLLLLLVTMWIVVFYAEPGFPWHSYVTLVLGYYAAFAILLLVPIDIAMIVYDRRSTDVNNDPDYDYDTYTLAVLYNIFFTTVLILGSFVLGFEEYYNTDGYFTIFGKLLSSFKRMMFDTIVPLIAGVIVLGVLIAKKIVTSNADALQLAAVIVTNTIYEIGLMFLLGYALIEVPRSCWQEADLDGSLLRIQMKAASQFKDISEAQLSVSLAVSDVLKTKQQLASYADPQLQEAMDILVSECPTEFRSDRMGKVAANKSGQITIDTLAGLRTRLNTLKDLYKMAQAKVEGTKLQAYRLEDICAAKNNANTNVIHWSLTDKDSTPSEYNWEIVRRPLMYRLAAVLTAVLSILSLLGVICSMHGVSNNVSVYFLAVHNDSSSTGGIVIFILLTLGYTTYLTTWALFQTKVSAANELVPGRTTPEALSFNVRMVARLAAPLAFFYLGWISENGMKEGDWLYNDAPNAYITETQEIIDPVTGIPSFQNVTISVNNGISMPSAFSKFYQLKNTGAFQKVFGTVCPIILYIVMFLFLINAFNRLLVLIKLGNYQFGAPIVTDEQLREGKRQLQRHKKTTERKFRRGELKNYLLSVGGGQESGDTIFSRIFFFLKTSEPNKDGARDTLTSEVGMDAPVLKEPQALSAFLEKKGGFSLTGSGWKEFYAEVRNPGYLHFYKDKRAGDMNKHNDPTRTNDPNIIILDLKTVMDFKLPESRNKNRDNLEIDLDMGDETIKLKFKNAADVELWRKSLQEWKDYNIDNANMYGGSTSGGSYNTKAINDVEAGHMSSNPLGSPVSNSRGTKDELDSIQVDDDNDDDDKGVRPLMKGKKSSTGGWFSGGDKKKGAAAPSMPVAAAHDDKPQLIEGWLEKKGNGKMGMGGDWQKRYLRIDEKNSLLIYSKSSDPREKPAGTIDLRMVKDITPYEKNGTPDYTRFNVDIGDKVYKFKAPNDKDGQNWIDTLNAWRDHFLLNMT